MKLPGWTCPEINKSIKDTEYDLDRIVCNIRDRFESIRDSNEELRDAAIEQFERAEALEQENDKLILRISDLEDELAEAKDELTAALEG